MPPPPPPPLLIVSFPQQPTERRTGRPQPTCHSVTSSMVISHTDVLPPRTVQLTNRGLEQYIAQQMHEEDPVTAEALVEQAQITGAEPILMIQAPSVKLVAGPMDDVDEFVSKYRAKQRVDLPLANSNKLRQKLLEIQTTCNHFANATDAALLDLSSADDNMTRVEIMRLLESVVGSDTVPAHRKKDPPIRTSQMLEDVLRSSEEFAERMTRAQNEVEETRGTEQQASLSASVNYNSATRRGTLTGTLPLNTTGNELNASAAVVNVNEWFAMMPPRSLAQKLNDVLVSIDLNDSIAEKTDVFEDIVPSVATGMLLDAHVALQHVLTMTNAKVVSSMVPHAKSSIPTVFKAVRAMCKQALLKLQCAKESFNAQEEQMSGKAKHAPAPAGGAEKNEIWNISKKFIKLPTKAVIKASVEDKEEFLLFLAMDRSQSTRHDLDHANWNCMRNVFRSFLRGTVQRTNGRIVKHDELGSCYALSFPTAAEAFVFERCVQQYSSSLPWLPQVTTLPYMAPVLPSVVPSSAPLPPTTIRGTAQEDEKIVTKMRRVATVIEEIFATYIAMANTPSEVSRIKQHIHESGDSVSAHYMPKMQNDSSMAVGFDTDEEGASNGDADAVDTVAASSTLWKEHSTQLNEELDIIGGDKKRMLGEGLVTFKGPRIASSIHFGSAISSQQQDKYGTNAFMTIGSCLCSLARAGECVVSLAAFEKAQSELDLMFHLKAIAQPFDLVLRIAPATVSVVSSGAIPFATPIVATPTAAVSGGSGSPHHGVHHNHPPPLSVEALRDSASTVAILNSNLGKNSTTSSSTVHVHAFHSRRERYLVKEMNQKVAYRVVWRAIPGRYDFLAGISGKRFAVAAPIVEYNANWWLPGYLGKVSPEKKFCSRATGPDLEKVEPNMGKRRKSSLRDLKGSPPSFAIGLTISPKKEAVLKPAATPIKAASTGPLANQKSFSTPLKSQAQAQPSPASPTKTPMAPNMFRQRSMGPVKAVSNTTVLEEPMCNTADIGMQADTIDADPVGMPRDSLNKFAITATQWMHSWHEGKMTDHDLLQNLYTAMDLTPAYIHSTVEKGMSLEDCDGLVVEPDPLEWGYFSGYCNAVLLAQSGGFYGDDSLVVRASICAHCCMMRDAVEELNLFKRRKTFAGGPTLGLPTNTRRSSSITPLSAGMSVVLSLESSVAVLDIPSLPSLATVGGTHE